MDGNIDLRDVLDFEELQRLQDGFAAVTSITTVVIGPDGRQLTRPSNLRGMCALMQADEAGRAKCIHTNMQLVERVRKTGGAAVMVCPHSGLTTAAVPIELEGRLLGCWIIGQVRFSEGEVPALRQTEQELGYEPGYLQSVVDDLPLTDRGSFERVFEFLQELSRSVVNVGYAFLRESAQSEKLRDTTAELDNTAQMLRKFVDSSDVGMYLADYNTGELLMVNSRYAEAMDLTPQQMIGTKCWSHTEGEHTTFCEFCPRSLLVDEHKTPTEAHVWELQAPAGRWTRCTNQAVFWVDGRLAHMVTLMDVTDQHELREELAGLAYYDKQMALPNSLRLQQDIEHDKDEADRYLVCFDVASLRRVNEAYGRDTGDRLLDAIVQWVRQTAPSGQMYRVGGDEFCLYVKGISADEAAAAGEMIGRRFRETWNIRVTEQGQEVSILCGVSVAVINLETGGTDDNIITVIERTLDISRSSGGVAVYNEEMGEATRRHVRMELSLKSCVLGGMRGFDVHFQPIVDPAAGTWKGLEALCRWTDPETGPVPPAVFIKEAEQLGLIRIIGMWVLERAVSQCKAWALDKVEGFFVSVNLSPNQVMDEQLVEKVSTLLKKHDYPGECLELEVTESTAFDFSSYSMSVIDNLRFRGIRFALDDFGTGYSSFDNLKNLPVSVLKTERAFIAGIEKDSYMRYLFYTMSQLAHAADMKLIAEGIETPEQLEIVLKNGADYIQGYYFSKPLPAAEMEKQLARFTEVDPTFYTLSTEVDQDKLTLSGMEAYMISPDLFKVMNACVQQLLAPTNLNEAIDKSLAIIGEYFNVSRAYVFLRVKGTIFRNTHEWCAEGVQPQIENLGDFDSDKAVPSWLPMLTQKGMIVSTDVSKLPADIYEALAVQDIRAIAVLPMYDDTKLVGYIGLDDSRFREWLPEEVSLLRNLGMTIASTLKRQRMQEQILENHRRFSDVVNSVDMLLFATDLDSYEVVWCNNAVKTVFWEKRPIVGKKCHEVLHDKAYPCEFCHVEELSRPGAAERQCSWELYHPGLDRYYMVRDSLVRWGRGKKVHLEYALDISDVKRAQKKLEYYATTDALTDTVNRNSIIEALAMRLEEANRTGRPLSVAFVDVDSLKYANDTYGHSFGDELIKAVVSCLRGKVRETDLIGRYGGDEFILLLPNCAAEKAAYLIEAARQDMGSFFGGQLQAEQFSFSYGVVESTELPYSPDMRVINAFVNLADDRMREYKKISKLNNE